MQIIKMADSLRQIASLFPALTKLEIDVNTVPSSPELPLSLASFQALAWLLGVVQDDDQEDTHTQERRLIPHPRKITIRGVIVQEEDGINQCWDPIVRAIGSNPNLEMVEVSSQEL